jgi:hypothetical protein
VPGYPIRTPSDQSSVDSSPRTIAASHVLHRLLMPRHPPCALNNLTNTHIKKSRHKCAQKQKMLASTVQFSTTTRTATTLIPTGTSRRTIAPRDTQHDPHPRRSAGPVVLSGPNSVLPDHPHNRGGREFGDSTFLEQPPPTPRKHSPGEVLGPSTTSHDAHRTLACEHAGR